MKRKIYLKSDPFNDPNRINVTEAQRNLYEILEDVVENGIRKLVTKNGRAIAAITPLEEAALVDYVLEQYPDIVQQLG